MFCCLPIQSWQYTIQEGYKEQGDIWQGVEKNTFHQQQIKQATTNRYLTNWHSFPQIRNCLLNVNYNMFDKLIICSELVKVGIKDKELALHYK